MWLADLAGVLTTPSLAGAGLFKRSCPFASGHTDLGLELGHKLGPDQGVQRAMQVCGCIDAHCRCAVA